MSKTAEKMDTDGAVARLFNRNRKLNNNHAHLDEDMRLWQEEFCRIKTYVDPTTGKRIDYPENGMLGYMMGSVPIMIYDLPELRARVDTAFVTPTRHMFISAHFAKRLIKSQLDGRDGLFFIFRHELEHLRRMHCNRMMNIDPETANIAQDARINIDCVQIGSEVQLARHGGADYKTPDRESETFLSTVRQYYNNMCPAVAIGVAQNYEGYKKWGNQAEEFIAEQMIKEREAKKDLPKPPPPDSKLAALCNAVMQDYDSIRGIAEKNNKRREKENASDLQKGDISAKWPIAERNGAIELSNRLIEVIDLLNPQLKILESEDLKRMTEKDVLIVLTAIYEVVETDEMHAHNENMEQLPITALTGDLYVDQLKPLERSMLLVEVLRDLLKPRMGKGLCENGIIDTREANKTLNRGNGSPDDLLRETAGLDGVAPPANIYRGDEHSMSAEELAQILKQAGMDTAVKQLGFDDLIKITAEENAARGSITNAINDAVEDEKKVGANRIPGGHLVQYAVARMNDFFKPVLTLKMTIKQIMEDAVASTVRYDPDEAWIYSQMEPEDLGVASALDIPMNGTYVPGDTKRRTIPLLIDTSGSVSDAQLKRLVSEAINMARNTGGSSPPDIFITFADTIARGEPVFINESNYLEFLAKGIEYGGRGGTSFQASLENLYEMTRPGELLHGKDIASIIYLTDTYDVLPDYGKLTARAEDCGMNRLPPHLFIAPIECFNPSFAEGVKDWADTIFFDPEVELTIDLDEVEASRGNVMLGSKTDHDSEKPAKKSRKKNAGAALAASP
jgi:hypothetical protein